MLQLVLGDMNFLFEPGQAQILFLDFVKVLFILGAVLYLIFAFVVVRQIQVMRNSVITPAANVIQMLGLTHLLLALAVLGWFVISL